MKNKLSDLEKIEIKLCILTVIAKVVLPTLRNGFLIWTIGNLSTYLFDINYTWTLLHGMLCALGITFIKQLFSPEL